MRWLKEQDGGTVISVRVTPRSSKNVIAGEVEGALKIKLQAPPVEGKANKALIEFLSNTLDVSKSSISLLAGETGRNKRVFVAGLRPDAIARLLVQS